MPKFVSSSFAAPLAALALMAGSGVALAATEGALPGQHPDEVVATPTPQPLEAPETAEPTEAPETAEPTESPEPTETASPTAAPEADAVGPSLVGLCHAYEAGGYANSTKKGHVNPAWTALETAAGGKASLPTFCAAKLAEATIAPGDDEVADANDGAARPVKPAKTERPEKAKKAKKVKKAKPDKAQKPEKAKKAKKAKKSHQH